MPKPYPTDTLGALLGDSFRLMRRRFDQRARAFGMTRAQWHLLAQLSRKEGVNQASLADLLEVEPITLCRLADRMEEAGWIERRPDPGDRRARLLFMTDKAWAFLDKARAVADEIYAEALAGLEPGQVRALMGALTQVRNNLSDRRAVAAVEDHEDHPAA